MPLEGSQKLVRPEYRNKAYLGIHIDVQTPQLALHARDPTVNRLFEVPLGK